MKAWSAVFNAEKSSRVRIMKTFIIQGEEIVLADIMRSSFYFRCMGDLP